MKILFISEKSTDATASLVELLTLSGYQVIEARSCSEALELVVAHQPEAILVRVYQANKCAPFEFGRQFRANEKFAGVRLIALINPILTTFEETLAAGFQQVLSISSDPKELFRALEDDDRPDHST